MSELNLHQELIKNNQVGWMDSLQDKITYFKKGDNIFVFDIHGFDKNDANFDDFYFGIKLTLEKNINEYLKIKCVNSQQNPNFTSFDITFDVLKDIDSRYMTVYLFIMSNRLLNDNNMSIRRYFLEEFNLFDSTNGNNIYKTELGT